MLEILFPYFHGSRADKIHNRGIFYDVPNVQQVH